MKNSVELMIKRASNSLEHAYAPYSKFQVAACIQSEDGQLFTGVNVENASYGLTTCAESSAICQMISAGQKTIKDIVILNGLSTLCSPCGACRQKIFEFSTTHTQIHLCSHEKILKTLSIDELLPLAFRLELP